MSFLVCVTGRDNTKLLSELKSRLGDEEVYEWPNCPDLERIQFVLAWNAPDALWAKLPNLQVVQSYGAGVDAIAMHLLPEHVRVTRVIDSALADDMAEYVLGQVLAHKLRIKSYYSQQAKQVWKPRRAKQGKKVGIMGLGELGLKVAHRLNDNGFEVYGWSASSKQIDNVSCFSGPSEIASFLNELDYLVCLLPLTEHTKGILNKSLFEKLPSSSVVINVARGQHLNEQDLIWALDNQEIAGASLDVFEQEPLPNEHPFWRYPAITITPHCAALTSISTVCEQIAHNYFALLNNKPLNCEVNRSKGY